MASRNKRVGTRNCWKRSFLDGNWLSRC